MMTSYLQSGGALMNPQILIIDCHDYELRKLKINLGTIGKFNYTEVVSYSDFYLMHRDFEGFSLILIDIEFPHQSDGFNVLKLISKNLKLASIPKIIITHLDDGEAKATAIKEFGVYDYISKPYTHERLSKSINTIIPYNTRFFYSFENTDIISLPVEELIVQQLKISARTNAPLSIVFMTPKSVKLLHNKDEDSSNEFTKNIYNTIIKYLKLSVRLSDIVLLVNKTDIFVLLHSTDADGANNVALKLKRSVNECLRDFDENFDDLFYINSATYPDDGTDLEQLIMTTLRRIYEQTEMNKALEQMVNISRDKFSNATASYKKFQIDTIKPAE